MHDLQVSLCMITYFKLFSFQPITMKVLCNKKSTFIWEKKKLYLLQLFYCEGEEIGLKI